MNVIEQDFPLRKMFNSDERNKLVAGITDGRDKAVILLMVDTGLRASEVTALKTDSVERGNGEGSAESGWTSWSSIVTYRRYPGAFDEVPA